MMLVLRRGAGRRGRRHSSTGSATQRRESLPLSAWSVEEERKKERKSKRPIAEEERAREWVEGGVHGPGRRPKVEVGWVMTTEGETRHKPRLLETEPLVALAVVSALEHRSRALNASFCLCVCAVSPTQLLVKSKEG